MALNCGLSAAAAALAVAMITVPAHAQETPDIPAEIAGVVECRAIADPAQRLACFDRAVATLDETTKSGEVIAVNKEQVRKTRRSLFGFGSAIEGLFNPLIGRKQEDHEEAAPKRIETTVASVGRTSEGDLRLTFPDAGTWVQNDLKSFVFTPRVGQRVEVTRAMFGSFFVSVNGQPGIKMRRVE